MSSDGVDWENGITIIDTRYGANPCHVTDPPLPTGDEEMAGEMDPTTNTILQQNFVNFNRRMDEQAQRHNATAGFINDQSQMQFMLQQQLVGAKAAGQLDRDSLAKSRLDQASVVVPAAVK